MKIYKPLILANILFLSACSSGSSNNDELCRNYAVSIATDGGNTLLCNFDQNSLVYSCDSDSLLPYEYSYNTINDFVHESKNLGLIKAASYSDQYITVNYSYDNDKFTSLTTDLSAIFGLGEGAYFSIIHTEFDQHNRPTKGVTDSNLPGCQSIQVSRVYNELENKVSTLVSGDSCQFIIPQESYYDEEGNLIRNTSPMFNTEYSVLSTDQVCL